MSKTLQEIADIIEVKGGLGEAILYGYLKPEYFEDAGLRESCARARMCLSEIDFALMEYYP